MAVAAAAPRRAVLVQNGNWEKKAETPQGFLGLGWGVRRCLQGFTDETGEPNKKSRVSFWVHPRKLEIFEMSVS